MAFIALPPRAEHERWPLCALEQRNLEHKHKCESRHNWKTHTHTYIHKTQQLIIVLQPKIAVYYKPVLKWTRKSLNAVFMHESKLVAFLWQFSKILSNECWLTMQRMKNISAQYRSEIIIIVSVFFCVALHLPQPATVWMLPFLISPTIHFWFLLLSLLKMHPHNRLINSSLSRWTVELQFRRIFYFFFKISVWCRRETGKKLEFIRLPGENASNMNRYFVRNISK